MPVLRTLNLVRIQTAFARVFCMRRLTGLVAVLFLALQLLAPSLASAAKGDWIEICSEYGITLVQIDLTEGESSPGPQHTDCEDCTFCAFAAPMSPPIGPVFELSADLARQSSRWAEPVVLKMQRYQWPESRGPPAQTPNINAERNSCASEALTLIQGGAPWT